MVSGCCRDISAALRTLFDLFETFCATGAVRVFGYTRVVVACIRWWRESVVWRDCLKGYPHRPHTCRWNHGFHLHGLFFIKLLTFRVFGVMPSYLVMISIFYEKIMKNIFSVQKHQNCEKICFMFFLKNLRFWKISVSKFQNSDKNGKHVFSEF